MSDAIIATVEQPRALAPVIAESKLELLRDTYAKGATPQEFDLFVDVCNRLRLDPFARQIYAVKRWNSDLKRQEMTPQVSIDGMRLTAERTGKYAGQAPPEWCGADGVWKDVWLSDKPPMAARVAVYRKDFAQPMYGTALYSEYVQTTKEGNPTKFWRTMPANQLAKCAESLALRKAFPNELSGVYSVDELAQADNERPQVHARQEHKRLPPPAATTSDDRPKFSVAFPNTSWNGLPMEDANHSVLEEYMDWCRGIEDTEKLKKGVRENAKASREKAEEVFERLMQREVDKAQAAAQPASDAVAEALEKDVERSRPPAEDTQDNIPY